MYKFHFEPPRSLWIRIKFAWTILLGRAIESETNININIEQLTKDIASGDLKRIDIGAISKPNSDVKDVYRAYKSRIRP